MEMLVTGAGALDLSFLINRVIIGIFFVSYRFRWFYDPAQPPCDRWFSAFRRTKLRTRLCTCRYPVVMAPAVAVIEVLAGLALIVGLLTVPAAVGIVVIMIFANCCTPPEEIPAMNPVDKLDWLSCYLRLVEPLYLWMAVMVIMHGPGRYSLDYAIWEYLR